MTYVSLAINWILFLALFPMAFIWLRRAWQIAVKRDFSEVALKRGQSPQNPEKYASYAVAINLLAGVVVIFVIIGVVAAAFDYATWSAMAGVTIWMKIIADFILGRQAHLFADKK